MTELNKNYKCSICGNLVKVCWNWRIGLLRTTNEHRCGGS